MKIRKKIKASYSTKDVSTNKYVKAADDFDMDVDEDDLTDALDTVQDNVEDLQDIVDDVEEDGVEIAINNNIADHYIAECSKCNGVFISAVVDSDQAIDYVSGVCPLCGKESDQYLKWVIKSVEEV